jgi:UDP-glucose 4-epimerase
VAGSHEDLGETRHPPIHLIPCALQALRNPTMKLHVYGNSYATPDGSCIRDYVHVEDIAHAHLLALKKIFSLREPKYNNAYNLGSGRGYSVFEVIRAIENASQQNLNYEILTARKGDPANLVANIEKARRDLGWEPKKSDLETIIRTAYNWSQNRK